METIDFNEVIRDPETISVVGGLLPGYPKEISYSTKSEGLFYIKITGFHNGIIYYASTGDSGKCAVLSTRVDGTPATMQLINITEPLVKIKPIAKAGDKDLYFRCDGAAGRNFIIKLYGSSKSSIEYTILDSIE